MSYGSGPQDEKRIIIFATLPAIDLLEQSDDWFCGGTFSTASNVFYQLYITHASVDGVNLPLLYAFLPHKKRRKLSKTAQFPSTADSNKRSNNRVQNCSLERIL